MITLHKQEISTYKRSVSTETASDKRLGHHHWPRRCAALKHFWLLQNVKAVKWHRQDVWAQNIKCEESAGQWGPVVLGHGTGQLCLLWAQPVGMLLLGTANLWFALSLEESSFLISLASRYECHYCSLLLLRSLAESVRTICRGFVQKQSGEIETSSRNHLRCFPCSPPRLLTPHLKHAETHDCLFYTSIQTFQNSRVRLF